MKTLTIVFAGLVVVAAASLQAAAQTTPNEIKVTAKKYEFNPSTIKVKQGDHPRGTLQNRPMRDTSKPANGNRRDRVCYSRFWSAKARKIRQSTHRVELHC